jgi:hypothetical protein
MFFLSIPWTIGLYLIPYTYSTTFHVTLTVISIVYAICVLQYVFHLRDSCQLVQVDRSLSLSTGFVCHASAAPHAEPVYCSSRLCDWGALIVRDLNSDGA